MMTPKKLSQLFSFLLFFFLIFLIFRPWFFPFASLTSGDLSFSFKENLKESFLVPFLWEEKENLGRLILFRWMAPHSAVTTWISSFFNLPLGFAARIFSFWPFLALGFFSTAYLLRTLFSRYSVVSLFGCLVYLTNTYILMIVGGGQIAIGIAYALAPLVLAQFIARSSKIKNLIFFSLILAIQIMFDPRIAYVTLLACGLYVIYQWWLKRFNLFLLLVTCCVLLVTILGLHSYWLLPMLAMRSIGLENLGEAYTTTKAVEYFSFAQFSNTISLLHPFWPENIFGKIYFMRAEFLVIPILAFLSLFFLRNPKSQIPNPKQIRNSKSKIQKKSSTTKILHFFTSEVARSVSEGTPRTVEVLKSAKFASISYFALLALIGAFLAKGANPPFGGIYLWLFKYFPGMIMFRDPTKFYLLVALSYSILIPCTLCKLVMLVRDITDNKEQITDNKEQITDNKEQITDNRGR